MAETKARVKIVNQKHPHYGEFGWWTGEVITMPAGAKMAKIDLDDCPHGIEGCYVSPGDIMEVKEKARPQ